MIEMKGKLSDYFKDPWTSYETRDSLFSRACMAKRGEKRLLLAASAFLKWHPDNTNRGYGSCGWCELYRVLDCIGCPIQIRSPLSGELIPCYDCNHPYSQIFSAGLPSESGEAEYKVYQLVRKAYIVELVKCGLVPAGTK